MKWARIKLYYIILIGFLFVGSDGKEVKSIEIFLFMPFSILIISRVKYFWETLKFLQFNFHNSDKKMSISLCEKKRSILLLKYWNLTFRHEGERKFNFPQLINNEIIKSNYKIIFLFQATPNKQRNINYSSDFFFFLSKVSFLRENILYVLSSDVQQL